MDTNEKAVKTEETLDKALGHTKFGGFNVCLIITSGFILANVILETFGISFVLPVSQCELNWTITERSILSSVAVIGIIISSHLWGYLADTKGRKRVILPTLILGFVFEFIGSFSNGFWMLATFKFLNGVFVSGSSATIYAYIGEFHTSKNRDRAIMIASTLYGFGTIFMSILAWLIINQEWSFYIPGIGINYKPWRLYLVACALPGLICGLILFALPESPKYLLSVGRDEEALEIIKYIYEKNTKKSRDSFPVSRLLKEPNDQEMTTVEGEGNFCSTLCKSIWDQTAPLFNRQFVWLTLLICFLQFVVFSTANGMYMWFPDILNSVMEYNKENPDNSTYICEIYKEKIGQVFSGSHHGTACVEKFEISTYIYSIYVEVGYILGFAVISGFIKIVHKKYIIAFVLFVTGACGIVAVLVKHSTIANILYIILLVCALAENLLGSASVELYPTKLRAMSVCISLMFGRLGCVFGTFYIGAMLKDYCDISFYACGGSLILAGILAFFIPKAKTEPQTTTAGGAA